LSESSQGFESPILRALPVEPVLAEGWHEVIFNRRACAVMLESRRLGCATFSS